MLIEEGRDINAIRQRLAAVSARASFATKVMESACKNEVIAIRNSAIAKENIEVAREHLASTCEEVRAVEKLLKEAEVELLDFDMLSPVAASPKRRTFIASPSEDEYAGLQQIDGQSKHDIVDITGAVDVCRDLSSIGQLNRLTQEMESINKEVWELREWKKNAEAERKHWKHAEAERKRLETELQSKEESFRSSHTTLMLGMKMPISKEFEGSTMEAERLKTEHEMRSKSAADSATSLKSQLSMEQSKNSKLIAVLQNNIKAEKIRISMLQSTAMETSKSIADMKSKLETYGIKSGKRIDDSMSKMIASLKRGKRMNAAQKAEVRTLVYGGLSRHESELIIWWQIQLNETHTLLEQSIQDLNDWNSAIAKENIEVAREHLASTREEVGAVEQLLKEAEVEVLDFDMLSPGADSPKRRTFIASPSEGEYAGLQQIDGQSKHDIVDITGVVDVCRDLSSIGRLDCLTQEIESINKEVWELSEWKKNAEAERKRLETELQSKDGIISKLTHDINERNEDINILVPKVRVTCAENICYDAL
jgi:hypothetical protein